jgi:hypothetical protein
MNLRWPWMRLGMGLAKLSLPFEIAMQAVSSSDNFSSTSILYLGMVFDSWIDF